MLHGADLPTFAQHKSPTFVGKYTMHIYTWSIWVTKVTKTWLLNMAIDVDFSWFSVAMWKITRRYIYVYIYSHEYSHSHIIHIASWSVQDLDVNHLGGRILWAWRGSSEIQKETVKEFWYSSVNPIITIKYDIVDIWYIYIYDVISWYMAMAQN